MIARYSRSRLRVRPSTGLVVGVLVDLDHEAPELIGVRGPGDTAGDAGEGDGTAAAGKADVVRDLRDRPDLGEFAVVTRDQQDPLLVANADGKRHIHGGEDHRVVQRDEQEGCHGVRLHFLLVLTFRKSTSRRQPTTQ